MGRILEVLVERVERENEDEDEESNETSEEEFIISEFTFEDSDGLL